MTLLVVWDGRKCLPTLIATAHADDVDDVDDDGMVMLVILKCRLVKTDMGLVAITAIGRHIPNMVHGMEKGQRQNECTCSERLDQSLSTCRKTRSRQYKNDPKQ